MDMLAACVERVSRAGYRVANVDATVVLEQPKLADSIASMRERIGARLGIPPGDVSIKAKTSEGMGYTGDGTGIVAFAVALIESP